jgi:SAM-dependent methyltransferase
VLDGRELPFPDASLRALFLTHVYHHIPDVERFLREAERVLVPGGVIAMIEVPHTPFARFFFRRFHPEPYDDRASTWAFDQSDAMLDSNQALSWIVFFRDRERFERLFPGLVVEPPSYLPWLGYLVSGGVTRRNLVPDWLVPGFRALDRLLRPLDPWMALHWHLAVRKRRRVEGRG